MAFEESFGGREDSARPYFYKVDPRRAVDTKLVIRSVENEDRNAMNKEFGDRKRNKQTREMEWKIPDEKVGGANKFMALRVWKDTVNGWIRMGNQDAAEMYSRELGKSLSVDEEVKMDGQWTDATREDVLTFKMASWIVVQATDAQAEADIAAGVEKEKNSQGGSNFDSVNTPELPRINAADAS